MRHYRIGRTTRGVLNANAKLDPAKVEEIKRRVAAGETKVSVARSFRVGPTTVARVVQGKVWAYPEDEA